MVHLFGIRYAHELEGILQPLQYWRGSRQYGDRNSERTCPGAVRHRKVESVQHATPGELCELSNPSSELG